MVLKYLCLMLLKVQMYYQEMITECQNLKQNEKSVHSVTGPGEQYMWCYQ